MPVKKILVVDDQPEIAIMIKDFLDFYSNNEIKTCFNPNEALELIDTGFVPDLIITDINMPYMSGIEMLKKIDFNCKKIIMTAIINQDINYNCPVLEKGSRNFLDNLLQLCRELLDPDSVREVATCYNCCL